MLGFAWTLPHLMLTALNVTSYKTQGEYVVHGWRVPRITLMHAAIAKSTPGTMGCATYGAAFTGKAVARHSRSSLFLSLVLGLMSWLTFGRRKAQRHLCVTRMLW